MSAAQAQMDRRPGTCECCDLPVYSCGKTAEQRARAEAAAARADAFALPGVIAAQFAGLCPDCGDPLPKGDPIRLSRDRQWVGVLCCGGGA